MEGTGGGGERGGTGGATGGGGDTGGATGGGGANGGLDGGRGGSGGDNAQLAGSDEAPAAVNVHVDPLKQSVTPCEAPLASPSTTILPETDVPDWQPLHVLKSCQGPPLLLYCTVPAHASVAGPLI